MTKRILIIALLFFTSKVSSAQVPGSQSRLVEVPGEIVYADKTVPVRFQMLAILNGFSVEDMENKIHYFDENGKRKTLRPKNVQEFRFKWDEQDVRMISRRPRQQSLRKKFLHLLVDGRVRFYEYIETYRWVGRGRIDHARVRTVIYWYLEKSDGKMMSPRPLGFRRKAAKYFKDCPMLAQRIKAGAYKAIDSEQIVKYYNSENCH